MKPKPLYISFDSQQVAVLSDIPEILAGLQSSYRQMLDSNAVNIVAHAEVGQKDGKYWLRDNGKIKIENGTLNEVSDLLKYQVALHLMEARPDLLWLHAGAVAYQRNIVLIAGVSGHGKSTMVTSLCDHGWTFLSDDIIPVDQTSDKAIPFPQTPMVRKKPMAEIPDHRVHNILKVEFSLKPEIVCRETLPIKAIIFPEFSFQNNNKLIKCSPAVTCVGLIRNSLNYIHHRESAVGYLVQLAKQVPGYNLPFSDKKRAAHMITQICRQGKLIC